MSIDFPLILTAITLITGLVTLLDKLWWSKVRAKQGLSSIPFIIEQSRAFFPVFLLVLVIRSFIGQIYHVPTGSLEPTVLPGDYIVVSQYSYGLRLPVLNTKIFNIEQPKRGDIAVFRAPDASGLTLIKRVIGLPGDHVVYRDKVLFINGQEMSQQFISKAEDIEPAGNIAVNKMQESFGNSTHQIYLNPYGNEINNFDITVPANSYFMMGDNRDDSEDSRYFGPVPDKNLMGKAQFILFSWNSDTTNFRRDRFLKMHAFSSAN